MLREIAFFVIQIKSQRRLNRATLSWNALYVKNTKQYKAQTKHKINGEEHLVFVIGVQLIPAIVGKVQDGG